MIALRRTVRARMMRQATDLAHDLTHIVRVWRNADRIATHEAAHGHVIDGDVLEAAVWLHEIGRGTEHAGETAADACVRVADELMRVVDLSELVWPVCEALISHLAEGREPETPEGRVLRDADWLDDLGAIGVARAFLGAEHQMAPALYDMEDPAAVRRTPDPSAFLLDLFPGQLRLLPERFATAWGQAEAGRRIAVVDAFHRAILRDCYADRR
jgi:uncharacterized protein